jgi:hypothetical protein
VPVLGSQLIYKTEDGIEIAQALGSGKAVILKNHGAVTIGRSVAEAVVTMFLLDRAAYAHLVAGNDLKAWEPDETYLRGERYIYSGRPEWIDMGPVNEIVNEALQNRKRRDTSSDSRP